MSIQDLLIGDRLALGFSAFIIAICCTMNGCQSTEDANSDVQLEWEILPAPPSVGDATLNIMLRDSIDQLLAGADVTIEGNMSHPGMQPVLAEAEEIKPGVYSAAIEFSMGGDWFFIIESTLPDERVLEHQINITGVSSEE